MAQASFTVGDLLRDPSLSMSILAGEGGQERAVLWAHSCEKAEPHRWLGPHELLMTIGVCVPSGSRAQAEFIEQLDDAGLSGIAIGDDGIAPRLTKALFEAADERGFPVLAAGESTPFAAVGRTVAAANSDRQTMHLLLLARLYQAAGRQDERTRRSGELLGEVFGTALTVIDEATGCVVIGDGVIAAPAAKTYPLNTGRPTRLLVDGDAPLDGFSLVHLTQVLSVDAKGILQDAETRIRERRRLLERVLADGDAEAWAGLRSLWGGERRFRVLVVDAGERAVLAFALSALPWAAAPNGGRQMIAVAAGELDAVRELVAEAGVVAGVSTEYQSPADLAGAVAEAETAREEASARGEAWREFVGRRVSLLARSRSESDEIIRMVLGELAGDEPRHDSLRETLFAFLDCDARWNRTAEALGIHRQSLVYRLDQVERITGRSVRRVKDLSEFWLARCAWRADIREGRRGVRTDGGGLAG